MGTDTLMKSTLGGNHPFKQEFPYGTRRIIEGTECVYMPDPWTFPEGYGNAWCSIPALEKDGISYPKEVYRGS